MSERGFLRPKDWRSFQHYKDRNPPWIRLHKTLLDNLEFHRLPPYASKLLVLLWLMASENLEGNIPNDPALIAFRLRLEEDQVRAAMDQILAARFLVQAGSEQAEEGEGKPLSQRIRESNGFGSRHISDKVKRSVWERDGGACRACKSPSDIEFDHIIPVSKGGDGSEENIQLLCRPCNRKKRVKTAEQLATPAQPSSEQAATPAQPWLSLRTSETETDAETDAETEASQRLRGDKPLAQVDSSGVVENKTRGRAKKRSPAQSGPQLPGVDAPPASPTGAEEANAPSLGSRVWTAYSGAFLARYGVPPVRNARANALCAQIATRLGDEGPSVAAFFLRHNQTLYVRSKHPLDLLVRDAEGLATDYRRQTVTTDAEARQLDRTQGNFNSFAGLIAEARAKEGSSC